MKKIYLFAGMAALMLASCSTDEQTTGDGYVAGSKITLKASLPNSGTRVTEEANDTYGLITNWSDDDSLDVLLENSGKIVSMTKGDGNTFTYTPTNSSDAYCFNKGYTIYGVNNKSNDNITTIYTYNDNCKCRQIQATVNLNGQDGTVSNLAKYDLMSGMGDPTGDIKFEHRICVLRLDINSDSLKDDSVTTIIGLKLKYIPTSGTQLFATKLLVGLGQTCNENFSGADSLYLQNTNIPVVDGKATVYVVVPHRLNLYGNLTVTIKGTDGTNNLPKLYDQVISMSNARMVNSTVHPQAIKDLSRRRNPVKPGYYLFDDGSWGPLGDTISTKPIAVIFSNKTSTTDQGYGWTHGYAMALKIAKKSVSWGPATTNPTGIYFTTADKNLMIRDKDGYTYTQKMNNSTYPAAYAATSYNLTVPVPVYTSGWYLPSSGQLHDIAVNLGGCEDKNDYYITWITPSITTFVANINKYLTPLSSGNFDAFISGSDAYNSYWSSTEMSISNVYVLSLNSVGLYSYNKSSPSNNLFPSVRSVIAF